MVAVGEQGGWVYRRSTLPIGGTDRSIPFTVHISPLNVADTDGIVSREALAAARDTIMAIRPANSGVTVQAIAG